MTAENRPENILPFEHPFPSDILPTGRFLSKLPGVDEEYSKFFGEGKTVWNGVSSLKGEQARLMIAHVNKDTVFQIRGDGWEEQWEMEESLYCNTVKIVRKKVVLSGTPLTPDSQIGIKDTPWAVLDFCSEDKSSGISRCDNCFINSPEQQERILHAKEELNRQYEEYKKEYPGAQRNYLHHFWIFNRPSELPIRTVSGINIERSRFGGFVGIQGAIDVLITIKDLINSSSPLLTKDSASIPSSQSLISDRYFPTD